MAYFSFTQDILAGRRITEYRKADGTELQVLRAYLLLVCLVTVMLPSHRKHAYLLRPSLLRLY